VREAEDISDHPGQMDRGSEARHESDQPAATGVDARHDVEGCDARGPARPKAKDTNDQAGKRGRQKMARLVRMHGGLIVRGG
jgi:hypothetical protein